MLKKDTKTPLFVSLFTISLNVFLAITFARPEPAGYGVLGLAMAQSVVAAVEVFILGIIMLKRDHRLFDANFWGGVWRIMSVSGFTVVTAFILISLYPLGARDRGILTLGTKLFLLSLVTFSVHVLISSFFGLEEARPIMRRLKKIVLSPIRLDV
jgi:peptidoglycan biosynthesis protein MviN/MurJ (putative lipid II flippase)